MDPLDSAAANGFIVKIDGIEIPKVIEVSGVKSEVAKFVHNQNMSDGKFAARQLIGKQQPGEITVTRGLTGSKTITDWLKTVAQGDLAGARKTATVQLLDYGGQPIKTYSFTNCWVRSVELGSLKAGAAEQATEKFVVCYDESSVS